MDIIETLTNSPIVPTTFEEYNRIAVAIRTQSAVLRDVGKDILIQGFRDLIARTPNLESLSWKQYANYFNDGDECPFYVRSDDLSVEFYGSAEEQEEVTASAIAILTTFSTDDLYDYFDNNAQVTINADGCRVERYTRHD